jgi:hypothetical protein
MRGFPCGVLFLVFVFSWGLRGYEVLVTVCGILWCGEGRTGFGVTDVYIVVILMLVWLHGG